MSGWLALGACVAVWLTWSAVFCLISKWKDARSAVINQCRMLLGASVISLLVALPTHIVARHRGYCCAGVYTFAGIAFGIAVMLLSFGPGIYFLYVERWRKLHPEKNSEAGVM